MFRQRQSSEGVIRRAQVRAAQIRVLIEARRLTRQWDTLGVHEHHPLAEAVHQLEQIGEPDVAKD